MDDEGRRLNQIVGTVVDFRLEWNRKVSEATKLFSDPQRFEGSLKSYTPVGGVARPQTTMCDTVKSHLKDFLRIGSGWVDAASAQENANRVAISDILVGGKVLLPDVPIGLILCVEKVVCDLRRLINEAPVLDPSVRWEFHGVYGLYASEVVQTDKLVSVNRPVIVGGGGGDDPHRQIGVCTNKEPCGVYATRRLSGALTRQERDTLRIRLDKLLQGVREAKERANLTPATAEGISGTLLSFIFRGETSSPAESSSPSKRHAKAHLNGAIG
jgi:hypothetical protein